MKLKTQGKKKKAVLIIWEGQTPRVAAINERRTRDHWKKWARNAFTVKGEAGTLFEWVPKISNKGDHYQIEMRMERVKDGS